MTAHSPEPWTYDEVRSEVVDANGSSIADVWGGEPFNPNIEWEARMHANGHRIATLSAENARLREALRAVHTAWNGTTTHESAQEAIQRVRTALRAGGAE